MKATVKRRGRGWIEHGIAISIRSGTHTARVAMAYRPCRHWMPPHCDLQTRLARCKSATGMQQSLILAGGCCVSETCMLRAYEVVGGIAARPCSLVNL